MSMSRLAAGPSSRSTMGAVPASMMWRAPVVRRSMAATWRKERARHQDRIAALAIVGGAHDGIAARLAKRLDHAREGWKHSLPGMSPKADHRAGCLRRQRGDAGLERGSTGPAAKSGFSGKLEIEAFERLANLVRLMTEHADGAGKRRRRDRFGPFGAPAANGPNWPASLFGPPMRVGAAGSKQESPNRAAVGCSHPFAGSGPGRDFHQESAHPHRGDRRGSDVDAGKPESVEHPVKTVDLGLRAQPGAADHRGVAESTENQQIAGVDRHAGALDMAARQPDRLGDSIHLVADGGSAEDDDQI